MSRWFLLCRASKRIDPTRTTARIVFIGVTQRDVWDEALNIAAEDFARDWVIRQATELDSDVIEGDWVDTDEFQGRRVG